ncbi:hypothetical protein Ple7327_3914 [Pleurocapsa sp. PCC 7327]|uniref:hypothetical protein n=1 Tax=Pleurocapsa sp. PCC 7327 TaxID=118163 RepID=UPI00029FC044|nr:hypothetical protein [Pleurocapsa sp. PCC 7327]AFY79066.1 hypothetical protein Ple7327_3914 [Pleurocapsa sp. PCC 7327]
MIEIDNLMNSRQENFLTQSTLVDLTERELKDLKGGGAAGFASGFLGSLAGSAFDARSTGQFGFSNLGRAATVGLATGTVGALAGSVTGASLAGDD